MSVVQTLTRIGGCATTAELREHHSKRAVAAAIAAGEVVRLGRGRLALPSTGQHLRVAHSRSGTLSHLSAAQHHGWKVKIVPDVAHVTLPRNRRLRSEHSDGIHPYWADLDDDDTRGGFTTPLRTVLDCARTLPFDEALAVSDSALRAGAVGRDLLRRAAAGLRGPGAAAVRRVARHADGRAANPLESVLRAIAIEEGFELQPQLEVADTGMYAVVDLGSEELQLIVEAEGYETHGTREGLRRDCRRHSLFAARGWDSLRFCYEDIMFEQGWVRWALCAWRTTREGGVPPAPPRLAKSAAA